MSARLRRTISEWRTAPSDGTPFHVLNTLRFNPLAGRWEALVVTEDKRIKWSPVDVAENLPSKWLRLVPLPYDVPTSFAFTLTYEVRRKTWRERFAERLLGKLHYVMRYMLCADFASTDRSPEGQDAQRLDAKHESAVAATGGETPMPKLPNQSRSGGGNASSGNPPPSNQ